TIVGGEQALRALCAASSYGTVGTMQPGKRIEGAMLTERTHISIRVPPGEHRLPELADFAARCEDAGLDGIGVPDHHHIGRDAYMVLAARSEEHTSELQSR